MRHGLLVTMVCILVTLAFGCTKETAPIPEQINYRLKWLFNVSVAGDLYADVHGYFAEEGLRVNVKAGGPEKDAIKELELGHAQFGVASADQVIRAVSKGSPIVVLTQLFQINPLQWIYRPREIPIHTPDDLKGKTLGITYGGNDETIMRALMAKYGITDNQVTLFSVRYDYTPFYQRQVDIWPVYRNAQGILIGGKLAKAGEEAAFFDPSAFGIRFVANSVITTQEMVSTYPHVVEKFKRALLKGWRAAMDPDNAKKTIDTVHKFDPDTSPQLIGQQLEITRSLIHPKTEIPIGQIDIDAWQQTEAIMLAQKLIPKAVDVSRYLLLKP